MNNKRPRKRATRDADEGLLELLQLLEDHPDLVRAIVFDTAKVRRLLRSSAARRLASGVDARQIFRRLGGQSGRQVKVWLHDKNKSKGRVLTMDETPDCHSNTFLTLTLACCSKKRTWWVL